jgi:hypothetical protein
MTGDGSDTTLTLSVAPVHENNVQVFFDGVYQSKSNYAISGTTLTFSTAPPDDVLVEAITNTNTSSTTANILVDADLDTKIQVEESSDEDKIRFDTGGTERMIIDSTGVGIGHSAPSFPLHKKTTTGYIMSETTASTGSAGYRLKADASADFTLFTTQGTNQFAIYDNANTAERLRIDANGHVTIPHQPAFIAKKSVGQENIAVNSSVTITFDTEIFDQNADYSLNGTFTAPVTGRYLLNMNLNFGAYPNDGNYLWSGIVTSNRTYYIALNPTGAASSNYENGTGSVLADMDANDTAYVFVLQGGGSQQTDLLSDSFFSGHLVC